MIPIYIDTASLSEEFSLTKPEVDRMIDIAVKDVTGKFARKWENIAKQGLSSSRDQYVNSIVVVDEGKCKGAVMLVGEVPNMVESGVGAFDMKAGFAKSPKKIQKEGGGWYLTIPFRFSTHGAVGERSVFMDSMPEEIYNIVKKKPLSQAIEGGKRSKGLTLDELPASMKTQAVRPGVSSVPESKTFNEYKNKSAKFEGLTKVKDTDTGQNRYMAFRRVSDNSDPEAFVHTGISAHNFAEKALGELDIPKIVDVSIDNYLNSLGF